jgi:hypothetical protein
MEKEKAAKQVGGSVFVGCMFIGGGLGLAFGDMLIGGAIGMGVGFLALAGIRAYYLRQG